MRDAYEEWKDRELLLDHENDPESFRQPLFNLLPNKSKPMQSQYLDREGKPVEIGDWITTPEGRNLEVLEKTPGGFLSLKANDGKFMPNWLYCWNKVRACLKNPILSPDPK